MTPGQLATIVLFVKSQVGAPYIWGGKGDGRWSLAGLQPTGFGMQVFDCSGLVTSAMLHAGSKDMRLTHSAQVMFNMFPKVQSPKMPVESPILMFFGRGPNAVTHVGILTPEGLYEAAGAGSDCVDLATAKKKNACVKLTPYKQIRRDFVGYRGFP